MGTTVTKLYDVLITLAIHVGSGVGGLFVVDVTREHRYVGENKMNQPLLEFVDGGVVEAVIRPFRSIALRERNTEVDSSCVSVFKMIIYLYQILIRAQN